MAAIPIMTCGRSPVVAGMVRDAMPAGYKVIYSGHELPKTEQEVPLILAGRAPPEAEIHTKVSSNDFVTDGPPRAVCLGGGYAEADVESLLTAIRRENSGQLPVPFLRPDREALAKEPAAPGSPEYCQIIGRRVAEALRGLGIGQNLTAEEKEAGQKKINEGNGVFWF